MNYDIIAKINEFWSFKTIGVCRILKIEINTSGIMYEVISLETFKTTKIFQENLQNRYKLEKELKNE